MAPARAWCFLWCMFLFFPSPETSNASNLNKWKTLHQNKNPAVNKEGERENFYFNPPNRLCRNEFMEVCKLSFWMWCKCEHAMSRTGWRLAKYIAMRRRMNDLVKNIGKEFAHGAQLGLLGAGLNRQLVQGTQLNPLLEYFFHCLRMFMTFISFKLIWSMYRQSLSVHLLQTSRRQRFWCWKKREFNWKLRGDLCFWKFQAVLAVASHFFPDPLHSRDVGVCRNNSRGCSWRIVEETETDESSTRLKKHFRPYKFHSSVEAVEDTKSRDLRCR